MAQRWTTGKKLWAAGKPLSTGAGVGSGALGVGGTGVRPTLASGVNLMLSVISTVLVIVGTTVGVAVASTVVTPKGRSSEPVVASIQGT